MGKILVSYFSASGVTKGVAEKISNLVNGELFEIEPVVKYTKEDLDWTDKESRSSKEMNDKTYRPPVKNKVTNIEEYEKVIIGFPVWWYVAPTIINTFIEENDLSNKKIYLYATSGGSGIGKCSDELKKTYPNLNIKASKRISDEQDIDAFIKMIED